MKLILKSTKVDIQTRSMENNVLFHNIPEENNEECQKLVRAALKKAGYEGPVNLKIKKITNLDSKLLHNMRAP